MASTDRKIRTRNRIEVSSEGLGDSVVGVSRQQHILREIDFHATSLPNRDGGGYLHETIEYRRGRLRYAGCCSVRECLGAARGDGAAALGDYGGSGDNAERNGSAKDLQ